MNLKHTCTFILSILSLIALGANEFNTGYSKPSYNDESAIVVDAYLYKGKFGKLHLQNFTQNKDLSFDVYAHSPLTQEWELVGLANMNGFDDEVTVGKKFKNIGKYRYFAVVPVDHTRDVQFKYKVGINKKSLEITFYELDADMSMRQRPNCNIQNAFRFSFEDMPRKSDENIVFVNRTSFPVIGFTIYGWDKKISQWVKIGDATCEKIGKKAAIDMEKENKDVDMWRYFAVTASNGKPFSYMFSDEHDDLVITVIDGY